MPRKAEESDTRQEIQRHDPDFLRKKKQDNEEGGFKDPYEDLTDVSVPALRNFLQGLLDKMDATTATQASTTGDVVYNPQIEHRAPMNPKAAAAMAAYQTGAVRGTPAQTPSQPNYVRPIEPSAASEPPSALDQAAAGLDRPTVMELIRELDRLMATGITSISMEKGDGFLSSIRAGIDRALGR